MPAGEIELDFGDGRYKFCVAKFAQIFELQDKCADKDGPSGPLKILRRLGDGSWLVQDVRETIRLGLVGGGMGAPDALKLTRSYVDERPWAESVPVARAILFAAAIGVPEDPLGKQTAGEAETGQTTASSAQASTAPARRSASRRGKSTT
jgi:tail tube GTA-gp10-like protein